MNHRASILCRLFLLISLLQCLSHNVFADEFAKATTAQDAAKKLGVGINLGNMLDAPNEGDWGVRFENDYAAIIRSAGFQHVRLPVKWSAHASTKSPFNKPNWDSRFFLEKILATIGPLGPEDSWVRFVEMIPWEPMIFKQIEI